MHEANLSANLSACRLQEAEYKRRRELKERELSAKRKREEQERKRGELERKRGEQEKIRVETPRRGARMKAATEERVKEHLL